MSIGYNTIIKLRRIEAECAKMGLRIGHSKHGSYREYGDVMAEMLSCFAAPSTNYPDGCKVQHGCTIITRCLNSSMKRKYRKKKKASGTTV